MSYEEDLKINLNDLAENWDKQPQLYMKWAEKYAQAYFERDKKKEKLEIVKAQIDMDIRTNLDNYGFDKKPTEAAISAKILMQPEYQAASTSVIEANRDMNIYNAAKTAMDHKKKALEMLSYLSTSGLYAEPSDSQDKKAMASMNSLINERMKNGRT